MRELFRPRTLSQVTEVVRWATGTRTPLEILGAGSKRTIGRPVAADHNLDLSQLNGIGLYEPEELVCQAAPGTLLSTIETALAAADQILAFEPLDPALLLGGERGRQTMGGVFSANLSGPRRLRDGAARDHLLGFKAVTGHGEEIRSGGRVVKNVTGYDLSKLVCGAWGTLAVLTDITFKVAPAPESRATLLMLGQSNATALQAMAAAMGSPHDVSGACHVPSGLAAGTIEGPVTALRLEGMAEPVATRTAALKTELARFDGPMRVLGDRETLDFWRAVRDVAPIASPGTNPVWRLSVPPKTGATVLAAIQSKIADARGFFDWAGGLIWLAVPPDETAHGDIVRQAAVSAGGHGTLIRAPATTRHALAGFPPQAATIAALSARIKASFDPLGILNPGRLTGNI